MFRTLIPLEPARKTVSHAPHEVSKKALKINNPNSDSTSRLALTNRVDSDWILDEKTDKQRFRFSRGDEGTCHWIDKSDERLWCPSAVFLEKCSKLICKQTSTSFLLTSMGFIQASERARNEPEFDASRSLACEALLSSPLTCSCPGTSVQQLRQKSAKLPGRSALTACQRKGVLRGGSRGGGLWMVSPIYSEEFQIKSEKLLSFNGKLTRNGRRRTAAAPLKTSAGSPGSTLFNSTRTPSAP